MIGVLFGNISRDQTTSQSVVTGHDLQNHFKVYDLIMPTKPLVSLPFLLLLFCATVNALHFYLDANERRCFIEELPTDTVVEGEYLFLPCLRGMSLIEQTKSGHYRALEWSEGPQVYVENPELGIIVQVDVCYRFLTQRLTLTP